jgi:hypothetical protein
LAAKLPERLRFLGFRPARVRPAESSAGAWEDWNVRVPSNFPPLRVNGAVTFLARELGGQVYRAEQDSADLALVRLHVGAGNVVTDVVQLQVERKLRFKGSIAFVIDDVGYRPAAGTMQLVRLPFALTFAVLPGHEAGVEVARAALATGKQVIVHLPMEPNGAPGNIEPNTITTAMTDEAIRRQTIGHLESVPGVSGVNNHMGSKATEDQRVMREVLGVLRTRGLFFLDSRTTPLTVGERLAREMGVRTGARNVFLDNERATRLVIEEIEKVAAVAARDGQAIAIGHDRAETYAALAQALPRLEAQGFRICALGDLLR